jgi:UDP-2,3-diacylglucosamine pyrophosphatase LpxH
LVHALSPGHAGSPGSGGASPYRAGAYDAKQKQALTPVCVSTLWSGVARARAAMKLVARWAQVTASFELPLSQTLENLPIFLYSFRVIVCTKMIVIVGNLGLSILRGHGGDGIHKGMNDIRYVCLSDLHLGAENSILTRLSSPSDSAVNLKADPTTASEVMVQFVNCLRLLISQNHGRQKPTLILNGDALELALADVNLAAMVFERFMELTMQPGQELFDKTIYYNPGNHDHHLWETARETQYVEKYLSSTKWGDNLAAPWHTSNMFLEEYDPVPCYLLDTLMTRFEPVFENGVSPHFLVVYPNFGVRSADGQKCVIFSHGHYIESIYRLMTTLRTTLFPDRAEPNFIWDLESENFAWVDFFWSTLGRSGDFGTDVELIYDKLQADVQLRKLVSNLASGIAAKYGLSWFPRSVEHLVLSSVLNFFLNDVAKREVKQTDAALSKNAESGLRQFLEKYLLKQIQTDNGGSVPADVTFIFGHTHKPFEETRSFAGYGNEVKVFNDGGWVVDSMVPAPLQGAAVILVDEDLNTASVRLYNQADSDTERPSPPRVSEVINNPLVQRLKSVMSTSAASLNGLTESVFAQIPRQRANLTAKIQEQC